MLSSTCFEQPNVHPQEDLYMFEYQTHPDIDQIVYMDARKNTIKQHVLVFLKNETLVVGSRSKTL